MPREVPQYIRQIGIGSLPQVQYSFAQAEATQRVSRELGDIGLEMARKSNEISKLDTQATLHENLQRMAQESGANPDLLRQKVDSFGKEFFKNNADAEMMAKYRLYALPYIDNATEKHNRNLDTELQTKASTSLQLSMNSLQEIVPNLNSPIPEKAKAASAAIQEMAKEVEGVAGTKGADGTYIFSPEQQVRMLSSVPSAIVSSLPPDKQLDIIGGPSVNTFESITKIIHKNEGGFTPRDGNTGGGAIYGITEKWHKAAYDRILEIAKQDDVAGQAAADAYLKEQYWDKNNIDALRPEVRGIVYDGLINQSETFGKKLLEAARGGKSPSDLLDMRQAEYDRLAKSGQYSAADVASWNRRLTNFEHMRLAEYRNMLDSQDAMKLQEEAYKKVSQANFIDGVMRGDTLVDAQDKKQRDVVNEVYNNSDAAAAMQQGDWAPTMDYIGKVGIVPEAVQSYARSMIKNGNPTQMGQGFAFIQNVLDKNPTAAVGPGGFSEQDLREAGAYNGLIAAGANADMASRAISESRIPVAQDVRALRAKRADEALKDASPSIVSDLFDKGGLLDFFSSPGVAAAGQDEIMGDYQRVYKEAYQQYNDADAAKDAANNAIRVTSGVSEISGNKLVMKYPPEKHYGPTVQDTALKSKLLGDQLYEMVRDMGIVNLSALPNEAKDIKAIVTNGKLPEDYRVKQGGVLSNITLSAVPQSRRLIDSGQKPRYNVYYIDSNGLPAMALDKNNRPYVISFDEKRLLKDMRAALKTQRVATEVPSYVSGKIGGK